MMKPVTCSCDSEEGVSHLVEYLLITSMLILLMVIMLLSVKPVFVDGPTNQLNYYAFNDIGNGLSTRIVDLYVITPDKQSMSITSIKSHFDIPDEVAGRGYYVEVTNGTPHGTESGQYGSLIITGDNIQTRISLSGIGGTIGVIGNTSSSGLNEISYTY
jgi:hypothetical protein